MRTRLRQTLERVPLLTAMVYTGAGVLPLFLVSTQVLQLEADIGFDVGSLGLATASFFAAAAVAANPAGRLVSARGASDGLRLGISATILSCALCAVSWDWWLIPLATAVGGVGNGLIQVSSNIAIFDGVRRGRQGVAFGSKQAAVPMASIVAGLSLPLIGLVFGWRWVFVGAALLAVVLWASAPRLASRRPEPRVETPMGRPSSSLLWLGLAGIAGAAAGNGLSLFIVPSAVDIGISEAAAGGVLAACSSAVVVLRIWAGWLVDRRESSGYPEMAWMAGVGAIGALVLMTAEAPPLYLASMPIALLGAWGWPGIIFFTVVHSYPDYPARASGLVLSANLSGTLAGPLIVGALAGRGAYPTAWLFVSVCSAIAAVGFVVAGRLRERVVSR
jgi:predicted MFS family arabinose efflux permease